MNWARSNFVRAIAFLILPLISAEAEAGELLVMPYSCAVIGGAPRLTPSEDQGYSVVGRREEQMFSTCAPNDPTLCKRWKIFRFDVNCGGTRVPWVDVAAAARPNGRAWVERGRLRIEMPARWGAPSDDACARSLEGEGPYGGGFRRFCANRQVGDRPPIVEMPDGFAPMMGLNGIFVADNGARPTPGTRFRDGYGNGDANADGGDGDGDFSHGDDAGRLQWKASPIPPPRHAQSDDAAKAKREAAATPPKKSTPARSSASEAGKSSPTEEAIAKQEAKASRAADAAPVAKAETSNLDVRPKIINSKSANDDPFSSSKSTVSDDAAGGPDPAAQDKSSAASNAAASPASTTSKAEAGASGDTNSEQPKPTAATAPAPTAPAKPAVVAAKIESPPVAAPAPNSVAPPASPAPTSAAQAGAMPAGDNSVVTASITKTGASDSPAMALLPAPFDALGPSTIGAAALLALTLMAVAYYQMKGRSDADISIRDIGALSLDGIGRELVPSQDNPPARREPSGGPFAPSGYRPDIGNDIPVNREQALQILGMGVAADVSETAIKKIVDGLRMSWHPDAATNDEDRTLRELRIKQINAAWDIISGKRTG